MILDVNAGPRGARLHQAALLDVLHSPREVLRQVRPLSVRLLHHTLCTENREMISFSTGTTLGVDMSSKREEVLFQPRPRVYNPTLT